MGDPRNNVADAVGMTDCVLRGVRAEFERDGNVAASLCFLSMHREDGSLSSVPIVHSVAPCCREHLENGRFLADARSYARKIDAFAAIFVTEVCVNVTEPKETTDGVCITLEHVKLATPRKWGANIKRDSDGPRLGPWRDRSDSVQLDGFGDFLGRRALN